MARLDEATIALLVPFVAEEDLRSMRVVRSLPWRWIPVGLRMGALTFDHWVIFRKGQYRPDLVQGLGLIAHESLHITQRRQMGLSWFLARYALGQFQCGFRHDRHPLEKPAIALQARVVGELRIDN
ncbi:MAG TPA: DUF4157 domain-containing protein [Tepidiformaceae bacterium]|nr:DUF4157 domain-containing protein [Tepidiformaceae bacterium]